LFQTTQSKLPAVDAPLLVCLSKEQFRLYIGKSLDRMITLQADTTPGSRYGLSSGLPATRAWKNTDKYLGLESDLIFTICNDEELSGSWTLTGVSSAKLR
jgi:hypothetical protein